jgi:hypothetical protein
MSPMSTAAMNSVDRTKAGVASGILSMTRMVGSTFGVAVLGAGIAAIGRHELATRLPQIGSGERTKLVNLLGSGASTTHLPGHIQAALNDTYVSALSSCLYGVGAAALLGAVLSWTLVRRPAAVPATAPAEAPAAVPAQTLSAVSTETAETPLVAQG